MMRLKLFKTPSTLQHKPWANRREDTDDGSHRLSQCISLCPGVCHRLSPGLFSHICTALPKPSAIHTAVWTNALCWVLSFLHMVMSSVLPQFHSDCQLRLAHNTLNQGSAHCNSRAKSSCPVILYGPEAKTNQKTISWHNKILWNLNLVFTNAVLLEHTSGLIHLFNYLWLVLLQTYPTKAKLSNCDRDHMAHKV